VAGANPRQELDQGPYRDPQRRPGTCLLPFKDDPLVVAERRGGVAAAGEQRGQGDPRNTLDQAAARGLDECQARRANRTR